jgi:hypothetical protein
MNRRLTWPFALPALTLFLSACQINAAQTPAALPTAQISQATSLPPATLTAPAPALTPTTAAPSATPTPPITPTCAAPATPDPNLGVGGVIYEDRFDGASGWFWTFEDPAATFSVGDEQLNAVMTQANVGPRFTVRDDLQIGDQQLRVTVRAHLCYERDEYGVMFRLSTDSRGRYNGYVFKLNCGGMARFELEQNQQATPLVEWTAAPAVVSGAPAENMLMVWMARDQFHFYINDKYLFSAADATYAAGGYGLYLRDRTNGGETVSFDDLIVKEVRAP